MFERIKAYFSQTQDSIGEILEVPKVPETVAIAAPTSDPNPDFQPITAVLPDQSMPGKFDYHSPTWKYLQNYWNERIDWLHKRNESSSLSYEKTLVIRGQLKEIKQLLKHTNQLAGITFPPAKQSLSHAPTDRGNSHE